jgi:hypothetical protein
MGFWWGGLRVRDHLEGLGVYGRIILRWILEKWVGKALTACMWLQLVGFCERGYETFGFPKMRGISGLAEELLASQKKNSVPWNYCIWFKVAC